MEKEKNFQKIFIIYFCVLLAFVGIRIASNLGAFDGMNDLVADLVSTLIIQIGILFLLPFTMYVLMTKQKPKQMFNDFGYKKINAKAVLICFAIGILVYILNIFVANFFSIIIHLSGFNFGTSSGSLPYQTFPQFLLGLFSVAVLPALCEEFLHRGMLLRGTAGTIGYKKAIILSSIMFGLMHLNIQQVFYATILGLLMGLLVTLTRSIVPSIIVHFCNNAINVYMSYAEANGYFGSGLSSALNSVANSSMILFFLMSIVVLFICIVAIIFLMKKLYLETQAKQRLENLVQIESQIRNGDENMSDRDVIMAFEKYVFPNMKTPKNRLDLYLNDKKKYKKLDFAYKIPTICCIFMATVITLYTFLWGCVW